MTAEKTDLQKLEALLHSATNERQKKMYQALLTKARALSISSNSAQTTHEFEKSSSLASSFVEQQTTQSLTKKK